MAAQLSPIASVADPAKKIIRQRGVVERVLLVARRHELAVIGAIILSAVLIATVAAPLLSGYDPTKIAIRSRLQPPGASHLFGTDELGRDVFTRVLYGGRPVLVAAAFSVAFALLIGGAIGVIGGYRGGLLDSVLMRLMDVMLSFPAILLAILVVAGLGAGLTNIVIAVAFSLIPAFARLSRSVVLRLRHNDYVLAAQALGAPEHGIITRHILPNLLPIMLVQATAMAATAIATASALSFLGLGVAPPTPDWGVMVSDGQRLVLDAPHVPFFPGLVIALTVMSINFVGDGPTRCARPDDARAELIRDWGLGAGDWAGSLQSAICNRQSRN